jgi:hypothetical protein
MYNNNINGGVGKGGGGRGVLSSMDFYRRVPKDLTEVSAYYYYIYLLLCATYFFIYCCMIEYSISALLQLYLVVNYAALAEDYYCCFYGGMIAHWNFHL